MYQDTITLFNRKPGNALTGDTWYPTVIKGVNLNIDRAAILAKYGPDTKDAAALSIRYRKEGNNLMIAGKPWMPPKEWDGTEDSLTFATDGDFFWWGEWDEGIVTDADSRWKKEGFYGYMNRTKDFVFSVSSVALYSVIPHFEIMGK